MKKASQTTWLANINPNNQTAMCQVSILRGLRIFRKAKNFIQKMKIHDSQ